MTSRIKDLVVLALVLSMKLTSAQETPRQNTYALETNPLSFAFGGWSVGLAYHPAKAPHWVFNTGAYAFALPKTFVDQIPGNKAEGWHVSIKPAFALGADYYPWSTDRSKFAFGLSTVIAQFDITNDNSVGRAKFKSVYFVPRASYTAYVYKGLYLMPWLGVEFHQPLSNDFTVGVQKFEPMNYQFSPNLTFGYSFH